MTSLRWVLALAVAGSLGCGESRSLEGTWNGDDLQGNRMTFVFGADGRAEWILQPVIPGGGTMAAETIRMAYTDTSADPATIDFSDFDFGRCRARPRTGSRVHRGRRLPDRPRARRPGQDATCDRLVQLRDRDVHEGRAR
jgi:hypothetical protein